MFRLLALVGLLVAAVIPSRGEDTDSLRKRMVLRAQALRNMDAEENISRRLRAITDSLGHGGHDDYYFAARNVLIDQLFGENRFAEADAEAIRMEEEAREADNPTALAMSHRVRGQMFYKLSQPRRAMAELDTALLLAPGFRGNLNAFSTAASINEWRVIVAAKLGDNARARDARRRYTEAVEYWHSQGWQDPYRHFTVTSLAFRADDTGDYAEASALLDSASSMILPGLPARAYEHYYNSKARIESEAGNYGEALAAADTLLKTHAGFPWLYLDDLKLRARILHRAGLHDLSTADYERHALLRDSMAIKQAGNQLADLSALYRTELEQEHRRASTYRTIGLSGIILLLLILLAVSLRATLDQRRRNRLLVDCLRELDRQPPVIPADNREEESDIDILDRHMRSQRPYTAPAFSRQELARAVGMSPDAVARIIRDARGTTVLAYINSHRLDEARRILESDSAETLTEIAQRLGFGTLRTFQRTFSERYAMPPSRYRSLAKGK